MKRTLVMIVFMVLAAALGAQTGMLGLSYGDSYSKCVSTLKEMGFKQDSKPSDYRYRFTSDTNQEIASVVIEFQEGADELTAWTIAFILDSEEWVLEKKVLDELLGLHGDDYEYNDEMEYYTWILGKDRYVEAYWGWLYDTYFVDYFEE